MAAATWPALPFPQRFLLDFEFFQLSEADVSDMESGEVKYRLGSTLEVYAAKGIIAVPDSLYTTWHFFYNTSIAKGTLDFTWVHPYTGAAMDWRFRNAKTNPPKFRGRYWAGSVLELDLRSNPL